MVGTVPTPLPEGVAGIVAFLAKSRVGVSLDSAGTGLVLSSPGGYLGPYILDIDRLARPLIVGYLAGHPVPCTVSKHKQPVPAVTVTPAPWCGVCGMEEGKGMNKYDLLKRAQASGLRTSTTVAIAEDPPGAAWYSFGPVSRSASTPTLSRADADAIAAELTAHLARVTARVIDRMEDIEQQQSDREELSRQRAQREQRRQPPLSPGQRVFGRAAKYAAYSAFAVIKRLVMPLTF